MASVVVCCHFAGFAFVSTVFLTPVILRFVRFAFPRRWLLVAEFWLSVGCLNFAKLLAEAERLVKGVNILVVTPGRLLDHLQVYYRTL